MTECAIQTTKSSLFNCSRVLNPRYVSKNPGVQYIKLSLPHAMLPFANNAETCREEKILENTTKTLFKPVWS